MIARDMLPAYAYIQLNCMLTDQCFLDRFFLYTRGQWEDISILFMFPINVLAIGFMPYLCLSWSNNLVFQFFSSSVCKHGLR